MSKIFPFDRKAAAAQMHALRRRQRREERDLQHAQEAAIWAELGNERAELLRSRAIAAPKPNGHKRAKRELDFVKDTEHLVFAFRSAMNQWINKVEGQLRMVEEGKTHPDDGPRFVAATRFLGGNFPTSIRAMDHRYRRILREYIEQRGV